MILYLDTSTLVKLYIEEKGSTGVRKQVRAAEHIATSMVAYPEARSALARARNKGALDEKDLRRAVRALESDMKRNVIVALSESVARMAGELAERHLLRGFDSIHIASALDLAHLSASMVGFMTFDTRQAGAAAEEGLILPPVV